MVHLAPVLLGLGALAGISSALPTNMTSNRPEGAKISDESPTNITSNQLAAPPWDDGGWSNLPKVRDDGVYCNGKYDIDRIEWTIIFNKQQYADPRGCGRRFLDSFRGRCGIITAWKCDFGPNESVHMFFEASLFCTTFDVSEAIKGGATTATELPCQGGPVHMPPGMDD